MSNILTLLVGPPASGKTIYANTLISEDNEIIRINQDEQGKEQHFENFLKAVENKQDIVIDRMNFNKVQRNKYLTPAKKAGYEVHIIVFHEPYDTCLTRCIQRESHPTIKDEISAKKALYCFFSKYERVEDNEADLVIRNGWDEREDKIKCIVCDLDGTLANINHRLCFVKEKKKDWKSFFDNLIHDKVNIWCKAILNGLNESYLIIYATGRPEECLNDTKKWLESNCLSYPGYKLFSRLSKDYRRDDIVKEIILEFEILTRYNILFVIDDRPSVCRMWRKHGVVVLQCQDKEF